MGSGLGPDQKEPEREDFGLISRVEWLLLGSNST